MLGRRCVTCRFDCELSKHGTSNQRVLDVVPSSTACATMTLAQHQNNTGQTSRVCWGSGADIHAGLTQLVSRKYAFIPSLVIIPRILFQYQTTHDHSYTGTVADTSGGNLGTAQQILPLKKQRGRWPRKGEIPACAALLKPRSATRTRLKIVHWLMLYM